MFLRGGFFSFLLLFTVSENANLQKVSFKCQESKIDQELFIKYTNLSV